MEGSLFLLCWEFFKTGLFAVGGGLATLPFLYSMAARYSWFTAAELSDMIAVSESTPGPMGVNMATYVGITAYGILGGILATASLVLPSLVIIILISIFLERFRSSRLVDDGFRGLRPASVGLIAAACLQVLLVALVDTSAWSAGQLFELLRWKELLLFVALLALYHRKSKWHPIIFVALGAAVGILLGL